MFVLYSDDVVRVTFLLAFLYLVLPGAGAASVSADLLLVGSTIDRQLLPEATHSFSLSLDAGEAVRVDVEQRGIDIELTVELPSGESWTVDAPLDRQGLETALVEVEVTGLYGLRLTAREPLAATGTYQLLVRRLGEDGRALTFARAITEAGQAYRSGTPESRRLALERFQTAAVAATAVDDEARALYAAMVLQRLLDDNAAAIASSERVLQLFGAAGDPLFIAYTLNEIGLNRWLLGDSGAAREAFLQAAAAHRGVSDTFGEAVAASNLCLMDLVDNRLRKGLACYQEVLPKLDAARATLLAGDARTNVGRVYDLLGEASLAREQYEKVLDLKRRLGDLKGEARTLNNLGTLYRQEGEFDRAFAAYDRSLDRFRQLGDQRWQARLLSNIGFTYFVLGEPYRAKTHLQEAATLWRQLRDPRGLAMTLKNLSEVATELGTLDEAFAYQQESLQQFRELEDRRGQAMSLSQLGQIQMSRGDPEGGLASFESALELLRSLDDPETQAMVAGRAGALVLDLGRPNEARDRLRSALESARASEHGYAEAEILFALARADRRLGDLDQALLNVRRSAEMIDRLRTRIGPPDLRASFFSLRHDTYELWVDLLMERHLCEPSKGWDVEALKIADLARARTLVELLRESEVDLLARNPELTQRLRRAEFRLQAKIDRSSGGQERERHVLTKERDDLLREIENLEAEIRRQNPETADLLNAEPLNPRDLQHALSVSTAVVYFALGEERSFLWRIFRGEIRSYLLPPRERIEDLARRLHVLSATFDVADRREQSELAETLGRMLLEPLEALPSTEIKQLAIVADGALHYVPFAHLRVVAEGEEVATLVEQAELIHLPSLATLLATRDRVKVRAPATRPVAIFADPLFRRPEHSPEVEGGLVAPQRARESGFFEPLPSTRREAESIAALVADQEPLIAIGDQASRERILNEDLHAFQILHLATHGVIDARDPTLSGLALSQRDASGRPIPGFLGLRDIYRLRLAADLVVLSGCRTALGREMRGEGLMGLVRGFMYAGAHQVLASLWPVEDRATAEFMVKFYRALWLEALQPAAALRQAQLEMNRSRRYRDPVHWSGFVLVGIEPQARPSGAPLE